jgi:hypothetical protein
MPAGRLRGFLLPEFSSIGWGLETGLPYKRWALEWRGPARISEETIRSHCLPIGIVELQTIPMRKIVHVQDCSRSSTSNASHRQIFTDGRPLPDDPQPSWNGYSTANWDGDTLVVHATGFRDGIWLDTHGDPITDAAKVTERIRRVNYGRLEIELTVDDPKAYTKPWTVTLKQNLQLDTDLLDYVCLENEKDLQHFVVK